MPDPGSPSTPVLTSEPGTGSDTDPARRRDDGRGGWRGVEWVERVDAAADGA